MRVVVTRPEKSARHTAERLAALGHEPVLLPLTKAVHHPDVAATAMERPHAALAVTSAESLRVLALLGEKLSRHFGETVYAVGQRTAEAAKDIGFRDVRAGNGTGAELAEFIGSNIISPSAPLLYLAGDPRSPRFEDGLRERDVLFTTTKIYEMQPLAYDPAVIHSTLCDPAADAVLFYSRENARIFFMQAASLEKALMELKFLCLSDNVAEAVPSEFHRNIKIARHPDEEGLFALL